MLDQSDLVLCCISDCLYKRKPPFLHEKLCWKSYFALQLHIFGKRENGHPYRIFTRSQNSSLDKLHYSSFSGRVDSHVDAPFSWLILFKRILLVGNSIIKLWSLSVLRCNFSSLILYFNFAHSFLMMLYSVNCSKWSFVKDSMMFLEFWCSVLAISAKRTILTPPSFTNNDSCFIPMLLGPTIRAGINTSSTYWSNFCKCWQISGIILML